jgi:hypothetical protein
MLVRTIIDRIMYNIRVRRKSCPPELRNYRQEQVLLDLKLATALLRANGIDPATGLDQIIAVSASTQTKP